MKKKTLIVISLIAASLFSSCNKGNDTPHQHVDANKDHICDVCKEKTPHLDINIDGKCDVCEQSWSTATLSMFATLYGEPLPYFPIDSDFTVKTSYIEALVNGDTTKEIKDIFLGTNKYRYEQGLYLDKPCDFYYKVCDNNLYKTIRVQVISNGALTYIDADYIQTELNVIPVEEITNFLSKKTTVAPIIPTDGNKFGYEQNADNCYLFSNGNSKNYLNQLKAANYYIDESYDIYNDSTTFRAISKQRTLAVEVSTYEQSEGSTYKYQICYFVETSPSDTKWKQADIDKMNSLFGEELPFINANFVFEDVSDETLIATSDNIDAFKYAVEAFENDEDYDKSYDASTGIYTFSKDLIKYFLKVDISVYYGTTTLKAYLSYPVFSSWPGERILYYFDIEIDDDIPEAPGSLYKLYYEEAHPNIVIVTVMGTSENYNSYLSSLEDAGYTVTTEATTGYKEAVAPNKTIVMYIGNYTSTSGEKDPFYTIEIQAKEKSKPEASFPINEINTEMAPVIYTGPTPTGSSFIVSYPYGKGAQDVKVTISGGDKTTFVQALIDAGFNYDSSYSYAGQYKAYTKPTDNLAVYIQETTSNTDYYMEVGTYSYF